MVYETVDQRQLASINVSSGYDWDMCIFRCHYNDVDEQILGETEILWCSRTKVLSIRLATTVCEFAKMYAFHLWKTIRASYLLENQISKMFTHHSRFFPLFFCFFLSFLFVYNFTFLSNFLYYLFIVLSLKLLILAKSYFWECRKKKPFT